MTNQHTGTSAGQNDKPEKHLFRRVVHGGAWMVALRCTQQVLALVRLVIIGRILMPSDYGLLTIALIILTIARILTETGFDAALVQRRGDIKPYLDAAWTVHVFRGLLLFGLVFTGAPYIVELVNNPTDPLSVSDATLVLRVIACTFLVGGLTNIGIVHFRKDLEFNKFYYYQASRTLVDVIVTITLVFIFRNVWALVCGRLAGECVQCILSYALHPHRPRFRFDWSQIRELWNYGKWGLGMAVIGFLIMEGDDLLVGKILGLSKLGLYRMAHKIGWLPITEVTMAISIVIFPAYAKVQDNIPRLRDAYLKILKFTAFLSFPACSLLILLGEDFTRLIMAKWLPMASALQFLAAMAIFNSLASCSAPLFQAVGRPKIVTGLMFGKLVFLAVLIYPLIKRWGITGAGAAVLLSTLIMQPFVYHQVIKTLECRYREVLCVVLPSALGILAMAASITGFKTLWAAESNIGVLLLYAGSGIIGYSIAVFGLDRIIGAGMKEMIVEQLNMFRSRNRSQETK